MVAIVLVSSFSFLALVAIQKGPLEEASEIPAGSTAILPTPTFVITPTTAYVGDELTFTAGAVSDFGTVLTFTIYYDYLLSDGVTVNPESPVTVNVTGNPGSIVTHYSYNAPGNLTGNQYQVRLKIEDNVGGVRWLVRAVIINSNLAPWINPDLGSAMDVGWGIPVELSVTCWDPDDDDLTLTWDFGDGSEKVVQATGPALLGVECTQTHAWDPDPELYYGLGDPEYPAITYSLNMSLTDGYEHWVNTTTTISIPLPHNFSPVGNLSVSNSKVDPGDEVTIRANATDQEGEPLTWTFIFWNSTQIIHIDVFHTEKTTANATVFQNTRYVFEEPDMYAVWLYLTDIADPELQVDPLFIAHNKSLGPLYVESMNNSAPWVLENITVKDLNTGMQDIRVNETTNVANALFGIQTNDYDAEKLTATWDFGDGSAPAYNHSDGGTQMYWFYQTHNYSKSGCYNVSVRITDGRAGHEVLRYKLVLVTSTNRSPEVRGMIVELSNRDFGLPGSVVNFTIVLFDFERDPLIVSWDFGDGSPLEWTNVTSFDENGNATILMTHVYVSVGKYNLTINFTDGIYGRRGLHEETWIVFVTIRTEKVNPDRYWDLWDYTSLGLFILSLCLLVLWAIMGSVKRSRVDMMGTTLEEYMLRKQELERYDKKHGGGEGSL